MRQDEQKRGKQVDSEVLGGGAPKKRKAKQLAAADVDRFDNATKVGERWCGVMGALWEQPGPLHHLPPTTSLPNHLITTVCPHHP